MILSGMRHWFVFTFLTTILTTIGLSPAAHAQTHYDFTDIGTLGGPSSYGAALGRDGAVVGFSDLLPSRLQYRHAFLFDNTGLHDLGTLGGPTSIARDINASGTIIGVADTSDHTSHGFYYDKNGMHDLGDFRPSKINDNGTMIGNDSFGAAILYDKTGTHYLGTLGGNLSSAIAINNNDIVVGDAETAPGSPSNGMLHAFRYDTNGMHDLGTLGGSYSAASYINDDAVIAGQAETATHSLHAFRYDADGMHDLGSLGGDFSFPTGINNSGVIIGVSYKPNSNSYFGFLDDATGMHDLGNLGGDSSVPTSINDAGTVVGYSSVGVQNIHAFLYDAMGLHDLNALTDNLNGFVLTSADEVNANGYIMGSALAPNGRIHAFLLTPRTESVPEPGYITALASFAFISIGIMRKRLRKALSYKD